MAKISVCVLILIPILSSSLIANNSLKVDSLKQVLNTPKIDSQQVKTYKILGDFYQEGQPDSAIFFYDSALNIIHKNASLFPFAPEIYNQKGIALDWKGDLAAIAVYEKSIEGYTQLKNTLGIARVTQNIGISYHFQGLHDQAIEYYLQAYQLFEQLDNKQQLAKNLNNIAVIYRVQKDYNRAIQIYEQSLTLKKELGDLEGYATTLMNLGSTYQFTGNQVLCIDYFEQAILQLEQLDNPELLAVCQLSFAEGLLKYKRTIQAKKNLEKALAYFKKMPHKRRYLYCNNLLAKIALKEGDYPLAKELYELVRLQSKLRFRKELEFNSSLGLAKTNFQLQNYKEAYLILEETRLLKDSLTTENRLKLSEEMRTKFDVHQKDAELKIQQLELSQQKKSKEGYMLGMSLVSLLLLNLIYTLFQKNRHNHSLSQKNKIIQKALKEKELLLKEIHHRVKNNMQFISSLLSLQSRHITDQNAINALEESQKRVQSMSILHRNLYQQDTLTAIDMPLYLQQLIETNLSAYNFSPEQIKVKQDVDNILLDVDRAIPIGLIINELIINILKHAFDKNRAGQINIAFKTQQQALSLTVMDNGKGMDNLPSNPAKIKTFGLKLIRLLVEKLEATWEICGQNGTCVSIQIPNSTDQEFTI